MRLIDADKLVEYKASGFSDLTEWQEGWNDAIDTIMGETPTVDAEPVRHGRWINCSEIFSDGDFECSVCQKRVWDNTDYCPFCGAKMDGIGERKEDGKID